MNIPFAILFSVMIVAFLIYLFWVLIMFIDDGGSKRRERQKEKITRRIKRLPEGERDLARAWEHYWEVQWAKTTATRSPYCSIRVLSAFGDRLDEAKQRILDAGGTPEGGEYDWCRLR